MTLECRPGKDVPTPSFQSGLDSIQTLCLGLERILVDMLIACWLEVLLV
jgi:hypothetical protein